MSRILLSVMLLVATVFAFGGIANGQGQEPDWYPRVIAPPEMRPIIQATPMELRPYRPLHFWGNTVRRNYYRGNPLPTPQDLVKTGANLAYPLLPVVDRPTNRLFSR